MNEQCDAWKPIVNYEGFYEVSDSGKVRAVFSGNHGGFKPGRILKPFQAWNGYLRIELNPPGRAPKKHPVHCLVLEAFTGACPDGMEARHLDGCRQNNCWPNLQWSTHVDNMSDKKKHGTNPTGANNPAAVINESQVVEIRRRRSLGETYKSIARHMAINWVTVWDAANRKTWKCVP